MINMEGKAKLAPEKMIGRLKKFFGKGGLGLDLTEESGSCLTFSGGGGYVSATVCTEEDETRVNLVSQEWENQVKEFMKTLVR